MIRKRVKLDLINWKTMYNMGHTHPKIAYLFEIQI